MRRRPSRRSPRSSEPSGPRRWPRSPTRLTAALLCFFDFSAEHWIHLKPPTRSSRRSLPSACETKITKGPGSRAAGMAMAFKLIEAAQDRWRAVNGPHLVALIRAGAVLPSRRPKCGPDRPSPPGATGARASHRPRRPTRCRAASGMDRTSCARRWAGKRLYSSIERVKRRMGVAVPRPSTGEVKDRSAPGIVATPLGNGHLDRPIPLAA